MFEVFARILGSRVSRIALLKSSNDDFCQRPTGASFSKDSSDPLSTLTVKLTKGVQTPSPNGCASRRALNREFTNRRWIGNDSRLLGSNRNLVVLDE